MSDVVGHAGLSGYAIVGLLLFLFAFLAIIAWVFRPSARQRWKQDARMPLDDETPQQPRERRSEP
ncbi:MAG TPA: cbb3-type cytochrome c oxidase subunit 3 [Gemmatimonadales bacterium]|nr:cbb3-type cytochrome c oxidase subunit 3 [Gemmatimonadales bacterium]